MKRFFSLLLAVLLVLPLSTSLTSCKKNAKETAIPESTSGIRIENMSLDSKEAVEAASDGIAIIENTVGAEIDDDTMEVVSVQTVEDDTVVRYTQTYEGVEVYGSSMIAASGSETYVGGTYYDFDGAFGDDFSSLVKEAETDFDWIENIAADGVPITYDADTLRAVIYIDEGTTPIVARCFEATLEIEGTPVTVELVTDIDGETCYICSSDMNAFNTKAVTNGSESIDVVCENNTCYAYSPDAHAYIYYEATNDENFLAKYLGTDGAKTDTALIHTFGDQNLTSKKDKLAFDTLKCFKATSDWYEEKFGYTGVDGKGGTSIIVIGIDFDTLSSPAANAGKEGYIFMTAETYDGKNISNAPEIFAHEYCHAILKNVAGLISSNQSGSLHEAISDAFAGIFEEDPDWLIGDGIGIENSRDIAGTDYTMSDFRYDYEYASKMDDYKYYKDEYWGPIAASLEYLRSLKVGTTSCNHAKYHNSMIVSHTLYNIWKDVLKKDSDTFGQILFQSLYYLPSNASL